jgi:HD-like signal output (HDOD) protein
MRELSEITGALKAMPPLPHVAQRVLDVVRDPEYSIDILVDLVRTDPALTGRILKLCNSALYGLHKEVMSVADAVAYLGTRNLVKLVLVSCAATHFTQARTSPYTDPATLWRHTYSVATACQWLAMRSGFAQADTAFTTGILHNIGKIVLSQLADPGTFVAPTQATSHVEAEQLLFGMDHATAAGIVVDAWHLPRELRQAVRSHHDAQHLTEPSPLTAIAHVADTLVLMAGIGNPFPDIPLAIDTMALSTLHLTAADVEAATAHVDAELHRNAELLNLDGLDNR